MRSNGRTEQEEGGAHAVVAEKIEEAAEAPVETVGKLRLRRGRNWNAVSPVLNVDSERVNHGAILKASNTE